MTSSSLLNKVYNTPLGSSSGGGFRRGQHRGRRFFIALFGFLIVLLVLATLSFYFFPQPPRSPITLTLEAPATHPAGEEIHYRIKVENSSSEPARQVTVKAVFPPQFYFFRATPPPASSTNQTWTFLTVPGKSSATVDVAGQLLGEVGERKKTEVTVRYQPPGYSFLDEQTASAETVINRQGVSLWIEGPEQIAPNQDVTLRVHYRNGADQAFSPVQLELTPPSGWKFTSADKPAERQGMLWSLGEFPVGVESVLTVRGTMSGTAESLQEWRWRLVRVQGGTRDILAEKSSLILLKDGNEELNVHLLDGSPEGAFLQTGQALDLVVSFANQTSQDINNSVMELVLAGPSGAQVQVEGTGLESKTMGVATTLEGDPVLRWTSETVPTLKQLAVGAGEELRVRLVTQSGWSATPVPSLQAQVRWRRGVDVKLSSIITIKPSAQIIFDQTITYLNTAGEEVPAGDVSWRKGSETNYRVRWEVSNGANPLRDVAAKTVLPENVRWVSAGVVTSGDRVQHDPGSRQVSWQLHWLPAYVGGAYSATKLTAEFSLAVTPGMISPLPLLNTVRVEAQDDVSSKQIAVSKDPVLH